MKHTIDPQRLREIRKSKGIRQKSLASNQRGLSLRAIQRYEKESMEVDEHVLEMLARKLKVEPEVLTGTLPMPCSSLGEDTDASTRRLSVMLSARTQLNFDLIAQRYGTTINAVLQFAPVLFVLFAEQSLKWRAKRRQERFSKIDQICQIKALFPALETLIEGVGEQAYKDLALEFEAIQERRLYDTGGDWKTLVWGAMNPATEFLADQIRELGLEREVWLRDSPDLESELFNVYNDDELPLTRVCVTALQEITGGDAQARLALVHGAIRVPDIPKELLGAENTLERIQWLRSCWEAFSAEKVDLDESVPEDDGVLP